jgi:hypothetical protein
MRWGYGGRRWSYNDEEGGEGELDAPRMKNGEGRARATLTVVVLAMAEAAGQRRPWCSDSDGRLWTGRRRGRDERREAPVRRAVSARALAASARRVAATRQRRAASDRWGPLVSDFRIKNHPKGNWLKLNGWGLRKILEKFMEVGN